MSQPTEENTIDEIIAGMLRRMDEAASTIEELENELHGVQARIVTDPPISQVGIDEVFITRELPGILSVLDDLPAEVRGDPCRSHELDLLIALLKRLT